MNTMRHLTTIFRNALIISILSLMTACGSNSPKPQTDSPEQTSTMLDHPPVSLSEIDQSALQNAKQNIDNGDFKKAENQLKTLGKKYPKDPAVAINLATIQYLIGDYDESNKTLEKVKSQSSELPEYFNLRGLLEVKEKKFPEAEKSYLKAISLNDKFANAHYNLALLYDIYYQDIKNAFLHYTQYLSNIDHEDTETKDWVEQLKYSIDL